MADFFAYKNFKGKIHKQRFNDETWKGLGPDKNGWYREEDQVISNSSKQGEEKQPAFKGKSGADQVIGNDLTKKAVKTTTEDQEKQPAVEVSDKKNSKYPDETVEAFLKHVEGFSKGLIKDHFDGLTPPVKYDNSTKIDGLKTQLGELYKYDVVALQKAFTDGNTKHS